MSRVHRGLPLLRVEAATVVSDSQHERIRQNLTWLYPQYYPRAGVGPVPPGPPAPPPAPRLPHQALLDDEGRLTDAGWVWLQNTAAAQLVGRARSEIDALLLGYYTGQQSYEGGGEGSRWLELLTAAEAARQFGAAPLDPAAPDILHGSLAGEDVLVFVQVSLAVIFDFLVGNAAQRFFRTITVERRRAIANLRSRSVMGMLVDGVRVERTRDPELERAYFECHRFYLGCERGDPLALIAGARLHSFCCSVVPQPFTLDEFYDFTLRHRDQALGDRSARSALRDRGARATAARAASPAQLSLAFVWFQFLFKPPAGGQGFVANDHWVVQPCVDRTGPCALTPDDALPAGSTRRGVKAVKNKRPDIVQVFTRERRIEVLDPTLRWRDPWHNFKTQVYCAILRAALPDFEVAGLDYQTARRNRLV